MICSKSRIDEETKKRSLIYFWEIDTQTTSSTVVLVQLNLIPSNHLVIQNDLYIWDNLRLGMPASF